MDNAVVFSTEKWGLNKDEVGEYIASLHKEYDELYEKYQALIKEHEKLNERFNSLKNSSEKDV